MKPQKFRKPVPDDQQSSGQSQFNSGIACLERIDLVLRLLNKITVKRNFCPASTKNVKNYQINYSLIIALFKELQPKMVSSEKESFLERMKQVRGRIGTFDAFEKLDEIEFDLRSFAQEKGMLMPDRATATGAAEA